MADYGVQSRAAPQRNNYGHASSYQRDAAFSDIFGAAPPPGRSQTMTSQPPQAPPDRSQTMSSQFTVNSQNTVAYDVSSTPSYRPAPGRAQPNDYWPPMTNGYSQGQRQPNGALQQQQPPPQYLPQPMNPERRPYPQPQRVDSRQSPQQYNPNYNPQYSRPIPNRGPPPVAALQSDPYRSRSMAAMSNPPPYIPPPNNYNQASANSFREQPYHPAGSRTTAQGRVVPERHDERAMSMTSWTPERDHNQTMSGRVIPNRRRESGQDLPKPDPFSPASSFGATSPTRTLNNGRASSASSGNPPSRTMSMASTTTLTDRNNSLHHRSSGSKTMTSTSSAVVSAQTRSPLVYPALLSRVAEVFLQRINAGDRAKNDLTYKLAFTGSEAVDLISYIIKTTDRNLALLLGRALDAQKFFHDVTYEHRLRDVPSELYQFQERVSEDPTTNVNGVFTLLTECYSPTCTRDKLCYSIACPRRLEQQSRLNLKPQPGLRREPSTASLHADDNDEQKLWINTVSKEVADSVGEKEKKRQEILSEIMYTERDFVKDLEYLRDFWMRPLRSNNPSNPSPIPEQRREKFVHVVFSNVLDIHGVNAKFAEALTRRQQENPVVRNVGDIFLQFAPLFQPFITYGANQLFGKYEFERERSNNAIFSKFVDETERLKESRKLELNGYLTKPTTRLARYPLLLEGVLKCTAEDNPDREDIPKAVAMIKTLLSRVNAESGKSENHFNLVQLHQALKFAPGEYVDLKLTDDGRQMIFKGSLKKGPTDSSEIMVYLFDHAVLLAKQKIVNKREELRVYRRPIPLELLVIVQMDEVIPKPGIAKRPSSSLAMGARNALNNAPKIATGTKEGFPITFRHLGKPVYEITLYALSHVQRRKWLEHIEEQQSKLRERTNVYTKNVLCDNYFSSVNKVNCLVPIDGGRKLVYGTDTGIYVSDRRPKATDARPKKVLDINAVTQIDVLEEYQLLLVLANRNLVSYPLEALDPNDNQSPLLKRPKKIQGHANFFKAGVCLGRHLVCTAKTSGLSTTVKVFEPMDTLSRGAGRPAITRLFQGSQDALKPFKEFYIPAESSDIHFLKSKLCVACARGFEVVSLETLERQELLDQADTSLDFVAREKDTKPIHIERLNGEFLLNYSDFSFFVNRNGWRARQDWKITWEGQPQSFALSYPYILAFEPSFIEIRHVETSACVHILTAKNIRMLHTSTREIIYAYEEESGEDVVANLDFWNKGPQ